MTPWNPERAKQLVLKSQRHRCPPFGCSVSLHRKWEKAFEDQDMDEFERLTKQIMQVRLPKRKVSEEELDK